MHRAFRHGMVAVVCALRSGNWDWWAHNAVQSPNETPQPSTGTTQPGLGRLDFPLLIRAFLYAILGRGQC